MAWEARSGLKHRLKFSKSAHPLCRNGLGSPFGIETTPHKLDGRTNLCRNGLGSPFGIETSRSLLLLWQHIRRNGLGSPFGIETSLSDQAKKLSVVSEWPGKPVR